MFVVANFHVRCYCLVECREQDVPSLGHEANVLNVRRILEDALLLVVLLMECRELGLVVAKDAAFFFNRVLEQTTAVVGFDDTL